MSFSQNQPINWIQWTILITVSVGQGVCVSGCSVLINQWFKQNQKYKTIKTFDGEISENNLQQEVIPIKLNDCESCKNFERFENEVI